MQQEQQAQLSPVVGEARGRCVAGTLFLDFQFIHMETEVGTKHLTTHEKLIGPFPHLGCSGPQEQW